MPRIAHIGILVKDLEEAILFATEVMNFKLVEKKTIPSQDVTMACFAVGDQRIEFLEPINKNGNLAKFLKNKRGKLHHIALEPDDFRATIKQLKGKGMKVLGSNEDEPSGDSKIAFLHPKDGWDILWEFTERNDRT